MIEVRFHGRGGQGAVDRDTDFLYVMYDNEAYGHQHPAQRSDAMRGMDHDHAKGKGDLGAPG